MVPRSGIEPLTHPVISGAALPTELPWEIGGAGWIRTTVTPLNGGGS